jgi:hypothetical protein
MEGGFGEMDADAMPLRYSNGSAGAEEAQLRRRIVRAVSTWLQPHWSRWTDIVPRQLGEPSTYGWLLSPPHLPEAPASESASIPPQPQSVATSAPAERAVVPDEIAEPQATDASLRQKTNSEPTGIPATARLGGAAQKRSRSNSD